MIGTTLTALTAFVVEDDPHALQAVSSLLSEIGIRYKRNTTGSNVIMQVQAMLPRPDVILLDFSLPHGDACAIASFLHNAPDLQQIPVIAMLDSNALPCSFTASQLGLADVMTKPLPRNSLGTIILRAVRNRKSRGKPQTSPLGAG